MMFFFIFWRAGATNRYIDLLYHYIIMLCIIVPSSLSLFSSLLYLTIIIMCRPQEIDEAARRRLVKRLYIPLPDGPARKQIVDNLLREQAHSLTGQELEELCQTTDGYSGADMANLCCEAAFGPVREAAETIQHIAADEVYSRR